MSLVLDGTSGITGNSGTLLSNSTIGVGAATPAASGAGISFPATQSASTDVNTLDDYEEGTWTPTPNSITTSGSVTYAGSYTKIGRAVYITINVAIASGATFSSTRNSSYFSGLPFNVNSNQNTAISASSNDTQNYGTGSIYVSAVYIPTISATSSQAYLNFSGFYFTT